MDVQETRKYLKIIKDDLKENYVNEDFMLSALKALDIIEKELEYREPKKTLKWFFDEETKINYYECPHCHQWINDKNEICCNHCGQLIRKSNIK